MASAAAIPSLQNNITSTGQLMGPVEVALASITAADAVPDPEVQLKLKQIRNMWQFSALFQWLFMFKNTIKMEEDDIRVEVRMISDFFFYH